MLLKIQAVVAATVLSLGTHSISAQSTPSPACRHCNRPTPFNGTQGVSVIVMVRDGFVKSTIDAVIRDEPGIQTPLIALKRSAITPALVYRAFASISEGRTKHNGPPAKRATTVLSSSSDFEAVPTEDAAWVAQLITQLSSAPMTDVAGVGRFPAVTFTLDQKTLRGK
jgi:hypothetical protein